MSTKKIVFLPYDFDTALGADNNGRLTLNDYSLEDIDLTSGGQSVYSGQNSVLWKNVRAAFFNELTAMYREVRSSGNLSYDVIEQMFEEHQHKWPEAVYNEDQRYKYILPLIQNNENRIDSMLGSKEQQRKWWLYNRFKYIDSKYNAGTAAEDAVSFRGFALPEADEHGVKGIDVTPYASIYATVLYGNAPGRVRAYRNEMVRVPCPLSGLDFTDIYIYSASQIKVIGDLSPFKPDAVEFSNATHLQELKIGDSSSGYTNGNLKSLTLGNNTLLKKLDVRNCVNLGTGSQKSVDVSNCTNIEEVYFDGTAITGLVLPNGGILKKLHVPATMENLTILNQRGITEFVIPSYSNITTLRIENCPTLDTEAMFNAISEGTALRLIGFTWECADATEIEARLDKLDTMRGLDEQGLIINKAQISGAIHTSTLTGAQKASYEARYPYLTVTADTITSYLTLKSYDGTTTIDTITCLNGVPQTAIPSVPSRANSADGHYSYTPIGWNTEQDSQTADADCITNVIADRTVYAAYTWVVRTYTVIWKNTNNVTLETDTNVPWGTVPTYDGATPTYNGQTSSGWEPQVAAITGDTTYTAVYLPVYTVTFYNDSGSTRLYMQNVVQGQDAIYGGSTPVSSEDETFEWVGWSTIRGGSSADAVLTNIQANTTVYAAFDTGAEVVEITDSWDDIIASINNDTYSTRYKVGNYKPLDLGTEGIVNMQIVAMDTDELETGGKAPLTFLGIELLKSYHVFNDSIANNYKYEEGISFTRNSSDITNTNYNRWNAQNRYTDNNTAKITWTVTAVTDGTLRIQYRTGASSGNRTSLKINESEIVNTYSTSDQTYDLPITTGTSYTIEFENTKLTAEDTTTARIKLCNTSGNGSKSNVDALVSQTEPVITNCIVRVQDGYVIGTGTIGGWEFCELRQYLKGTIKPLIPANVSRAINNVVKTHTSRTRYAEPVIQTTVDDVWIPSFEEVYSLSTSSDIAGRIYNKIFRIPYNNNSRKKQVTGYAATWWTRSASDQTFMYAIYSNGDQYTQVSSTGSFIVLGFCLGKQTGTITDSWSTIMSNANYATDYSIGDTKEIDLGVHGRHLMEIVAFDTDDRADGNGKAGITWVSKTLLSTQQKMNAIDTVSGGWTSADLRAYLKNTIKPLIPETVRNGIVEVTKYTKSYQNGAVVNDATSTEDVWVPSAREVGYSGGETQGAVYSGAFTDAASRVKNMYGDSNPAWWWVRSVYDDQTFSMITYTGNFATANPTSTGAIALSFCTN